jgi:glycosyltransferase involved in cell wall biosynthesis
MALISVVIPAYNCEAYIETTINSILNQQGGFDVEVVVINDGSTDRTGEICRRIEGPVRVIDQKNSGVCVARNHGIREAKGDFIALVDHDDFWMPSKLLGQMAAFEGAPQADVVFTRFVWWRPNPQDGKHPDPSEFEAEARPQGIAPDFSGWIYHQMLLDSWILTSTALARMSVVKASGGFDESLPYGEDWDFWLRISRQSQFVKLNEATTLYRQHPTQGSRALRTVDYRTQVLETAVKNWGLKSQDGRSISQKVFNRQLATYSAFYGLDHLKSGLASSRPLAARAFLKAWRIDPTYWKSLAYWVSMKFGWIPKW